MHPSKHILCINSFNSPEILKHCEAKTFVIIISISQMSKLGHGKLSTLIKVTQQEAGAEIQTLAFHLGSLLAYPSYTHTHRTA